MIEFNGKRFARNDAEMLESLFSGPSTMDGFYKVRHGRKSGLIAIEFFDHQHSPVALISPDGVLVTAYRPDGDKRTTYMYSCTTETERFMGVVGMPYGQQKRLTEDCLLGVSAAVLQA